MSNNDNFKEYKEFLLNRLSELEAAAKYVFSKKGSRLTDEPQLQAFSSALEQASYIIKTSSPNGFSFSNPKLVETLSIVKDRGRN